MWLSRKMPLGGVEYRREWERYTGVVQALVRIGGRQPVGELAIRGIISHKFNLQSPTVTGIIQSLYALQLDSSALGMSNSLKNMFKQ